jgi:hypothetical protein
VIEQGIVALVNASPAVAALYPPGGTGGFFGSLPKDQKLPSWRYKVISPTPISRTLAPQRQLVCARWQIDCFGTTGAQAIALAKAIDDVLSYFSGALPDPDCTQVNLVLNSGGGDDEFDDTSRTFRRMVEYELFFVQ